MSRDLEVFSKKELKLYKKLVVCFVLVTLASILSVLVYYVTYIKNKDDLSYCQDTGLFRTITGNKIISYTEKGYERINKDESIINLGSALAGDIGICFLGNDFNSGITLSTKVSNYINSYFTVLNRDGVINLSELFQDVGTSPFGGGEITYYPEKIENGIRYSKEWVTKSQLDNRTENYLIDRYKNIFKVDESEIPEQVKEDYGDEEIIGYIPYEEKLSDCMSDKVFEKDGQYFINVKDLEVDGTNGYVYYFEEQTIDLMNLEPSKELREINPDDRFTWIMQDDLTEVKGDWCYTYFKNKHHEELGVIKVKVKGDEAVDIEISGFE